ncbi:MAG: MoxR family ATPase [Pseudomonadota bacterium]
MLEQLNIYGMQRIEKAILAGLVTGEPVLLIGGHGTAKTTLCCRIAEALGLRFWAYDASKAMFEDVIGFPNPHSLSEGEVDYAPTPISIWGKQFVLIDELSRATPSMQNKWLEVIRSRQIMGRKLPDLQFVFAAMNPTTYLGANILDEALAGRFSVIVTVPDLWDMEPDIQKAIMRNVTADDAPGLDLSPAGNSAPSAGAHPLAQLIDRARNHVHSIDTQLLARIDLYVTEFLQYLKGREIALDGRRAGMMWRTLQAYLGVCAAVDNAALDLDLDQNPIEALGDDIFACMSSTTPFAALEMDVSPVILRAAHETALQAAADGKNGDWFTMPSDPVKAARFFIERHCALPRDEAKLLITKFIGSARKQQAWDKAGPALVAVSLLAAAVCEGRLDLPPHDQHRILESYNQMMEVPEDRNTEILEIAGRQAHENPLKDMSAPRTLMAFRMAYGYELFHENRPGCTDLDKLGSIIEETLIQLEENHACQRVQSEKKVRRRQHSRSR